MAAETGAAPDFIKSVLREQFRKGPPGASTGNSQRSFYDDAMGFFHAVAWREEKWLWAVIAFEILLLTTILVTKSRWNVQVFLFSLTSALVYFAENLNNFGRSHWRQFSTQDYFDRRGFFASCVLSGPLIFILFVQLITALRTAAKMMVLVKRAELKRKKGRGENKKDK